jgi:hypothetical protein
VDEKKRFHDIDGKTIAMHICRKRKHDQPDPQIRLNGQILEMKNTQKILGITFDNRVTWKAHITEAKAAKRMNVLRNLAGTSWSAVMNERSGCAIVMGQREV